MLAWSPSALTYFEWEHFFTVFFAMEYKGSILNDRCGLETVDGMWYRNGDSIVYLYK